MLFLRSTLTPELESLGVAAARFLRPLPLDVTVTCGESSSLRFLLLGPAEDFWLRRALRPPCASRYSWTISWAAALGEC